MSFREARDRVATSLLGEPPLPSPWSLIAHAATVRKDTWPEAVYGVRPLPNAFRVGPLPLEDPD